MGFSQNVSLTLLEPQPRFGDKPLNFQVVCPQNGTAVLKGPRPMTTGTQSFHKKVEFQRIPARIVQYKLAYEHDSSIENFQTSGKPRKTSLGQRLGEDRLQKHSAKGFSSKRRGSESSTDMTDETIDCGMHSERGALVRGSDPP